MAKTVKLTKQPLQVTQLEILVKILLVQAYIF